MLLPFVRRQRETRQFRLWDQQVLRQGRTEQLVSPEAASLIGKEGTCESRRVGGRVGE